jgi:fructose-1-phosphate kinase PfkB-like protein
MTHCDVLIVNPNPLLNLVYAGDFTPGIVNRVPAMAMLAEGKGVNVARFLARHGHSVVLTGFAGGHSGAWLRELISAEGIRDACIETAAPVRVGFMAASPNAEHPTTVLPTGFPVTPAECRALLSRVEALAASARLVIMSGSVPHPVADDLYADLLALCQQYSAPCWLDAHGLALDRALAGETPPVLAKPNRQELDHSRHWHRVQELHITDGAGLIEVSDRHAGRWQVRPPVIRQINPIGSGDCYLGGLAHGWLRGLDLEDRLRYAAAAGAANAIQHDVAMIGPEQVVPLLQQVGIARH